MDIGYKDYGELLTTSFTERERLAMHSSLKELDFNQAKDPELHAFWEALE